MGRNALSIRTHGLGGGFLRRAANQRCRFALLAAAVTLWALATGPGAAQQTANSPEVQAHETTPQFKIRAERNLVIVRVVVRDGKGETVGDLRKEDFRLLDDGAPQEITGFTVEASKPKAEGAPAQPASVGPKKTEAVAPPPPAGATPRRFVALFFDDQHADVEGIGRTRQAAWRYVTTSVRPQDRVAILTATGKGQLDFTDDREKIHKALLGLLPRTRSPSDCPDIDDYEAYLVVKMHDPGALAVLHTEAIQCECGIANPMTDVIAERPLIGLAGGGGGCSTAAMRRAEFEAERVWDEAEMMALQSLDAIERSVRRLATMPGQRSLVLVSPGFLTGTQNDRIDALIDRALQRDVMISAIDAVGLEVRIPPQQAMAGRPDMMARKDMLINTGFVASRDVLASLTHGTGGVFFYNNNDFDAGFREAAAVPEVYYVLSFSPQNVKLNGKYHSLKVTLSSHKSYTVRARRGYFASESALAEQASGAGDLQKVVFSLEERMGLPAEVTAKVQKGNGLESTLMVSIHVNIASLRYRKEADRSVDKLIFDTALFDRDGKYVTGKEATLDMHLKGATLEKFTKSGINAQTRFEVGPGTYRVREVVRDSESTGMSALNCDVEVPAVAP